VAALVILLKTPDERPVSSPFDMHQTTMVGLLFSNSNYRQDKFTVLLYASYPFAIVDHLLHQQNNSLKALLWRVKR
jgi:hypothetical protein